MMPDRLLLDFEGLSRPVALIDSRDIYDCFGTVFCSWPITEATSNPRPPILTLSRSAESYSLKAPWLKGPLRCWDRIDTLCAFIAEFIRAYVRDNPQLLCLHGAAAEFAGRLVVFPNRYRAGKSVLSACLAATGVRLFADDVLPIGGERDHGMAAGIAPRLRLPLPEDIDAPARRFIESRRGPSGKRYLYLDLTDRSLAAHGATAPLGAFVLLERDTEGKPELLSVGRGEVLRHVIWQNFAREAPAPEILERLHRIVSRAHCFRLRYERADQAAALLKEAFASWPSTPEIAGPMLHTRPTARRALRAQVVAAGQYLRNPAISEDTLEGNRFLADAEGRAIHHLNAIGSAVWHLLDKPMTIGQLVELIGAAFPEVGSERIEGDVSALLAELSGKGLVISGSDRRAEGGAA